MQAFSFVAVLYRTDVRRMVNLNAARGGRRDSHQGLRAVAAVIEPFKTVISLRMRWRL